MRHLCAPVLVMALPVLPDMPKKIQDVEYIGELGADWRGLFEHDFFNTFIGNFLKKNFDVLQVVWMSRFCWLS